MDNILQYIINLIVFVPIIIVLIVASIKLSKANLSNLDSKKYTKVLEKTNLNKDTDVFVLKIGDEGYVLASSPSKVEKIKKLSKEEIESIEKMKERPKINLPNLDYKVNISNLNLTSFRFNNLNRNKFTRNKFTLNKSKVKKLKFNGGKYARLR